MQDRRLSSGTVRARALLALIVVGAFLVLPALPAAGQDGEEISRFDVEIEIVPDGTIEVTEAITYDFGVNQRHGIFRDVPERVPYDDRYDRLYQIDVVSVSASAGTPPGYRVERDDGNVRIRIGDPDRTISGTHTYVITYRVSGALDALSDHDELSWNATGHAWSVPIMLATASVTSPGPITGASCFAGPSGSMLPCDSAVDGEVARSAVATLSEHEALMVSVALPKGTVPVPAPVLEDRPAIRRAFSVTPLSVGGAVAVLAIAIVVFVALARRTGGDRRSIADPVGTPTGTSGSTFGRALRFDRRDRPVEATPPDDLRPGQIGTLVHRTVNPLDVTATVVDLAARGYLTIVEIPKQRRFGKPDWILKRKAESWSEHRPGETLLEHERRLLDTLFRDGAASVVLSDAGDRFWDALSDVSDALYEDAVARGWFAARPDTVRRQWIRIGGRISYVGGLVVIAAILLTRHALIALPLLLLGLLMLVGARWMPRRTPEATALVGRIHAFRAHLKTAVLGAAPSADGETVFTRFLPYAVVFGLTGRWAKALADAASAPTVAWYVSSQPVFVGDLAHSMDDFAVAASGMSGTGSGGGTGVGGFSGGGDGGGGGGGGSW